MAAMPREGSPAQRPGLNFKRKLPSGAKAPALLDANVPIGCAELAARRAVFLC
jgi:hypothetical protein